MHVLMISLDTTLLSQSIGNARQRHIHYAELLGGDLSIVVCNRRGREHLQPFLGGHLAVQPTNSRTYLHYLVDGFRAGIAVHGQRPVDVIASQDPFLTGLVGLRLRRATGAPLLVQDHSSFLSSGHFVRERRRNVLLRWLARFVVRRADAVRVVNQAERLACLRLGVPPDRVCVIPLASDLDHFATPQPPEALAGWRQRLDLAPDAPVVLWVGRPVAFKNLPLLLRAFADVSAALPDARLVLAGPLEETGIAAQAEALGLGPALRLAGPVSHAELPALYQMATLYTLSSNYEGLPRVLLEAAQAHLPIVCTDMEGAADIVIPGLTGWVVPTGDAARLAAAISGALADPAARAAFAERAYEHVNRAFDEATLTARWIEMWRRVAHKEPPCAS
jgi:glycosyltransferase involved in cell wall biosynthesis